VLHAGWLWLSKSSIWWYRFVDLSSHVLLLAGNPKGVMHTHRSVSSEVAGVKMYMQHCQVKVAENDVYFSFLTLAHIFDRWVTAAPGQPWPAPSVHNIALPDCWTPCW
jgi:hypothetical protein